MLTVGVLAVIAWDAYKSGLEVDFRRLAEAEVLAQQDRYGDAFLIARDLRSSLGDENQFIELWDDVVVPMSPQVNESGATVFMRPFDSVDAPWIELGQTPIVDADAPRGVVQLRVEKPGYSVGNFVVANPGPMIGSAGPYLPDPALTLPQLELVAEGTIDSSAVIVPTTSLQATLQGTLQLDPYGGTELLIPTFALIAEKLPTANLPNSSTLVGIKMRPTGGTCHFLKVAT